MRETGRTQTQLHLRFYDLFLLSVINHYFFSVSSFVGTCEEGETKGVDIWRVYGVHMFLGGVRVVTGLLH